MELNMKHNAKYHVVFIIHYILKIIFTNIIIVNIIVVSILLSIPMNFVEYDKSGDVAL
jgi:hypothetical protein